MGDSLPPPASIDLVGSFARRQGSDVEIVLARPEQEIGDAPRLTLRRGKRSVSAAAELTSTADNISRVVARLPRAELSDGRWGVSLSNEAGNTTINARLLVQGQRPLVLLWGAENKPGVEPVSRATTGKQRVAHAGGRALDKALSPLPDATARKLRGTARTTARRVLR